MPAAGDADAIGDGTQGSRARAFEALGHGLAVWSGDLKLVTFNAAFARRFAGLAGGLAPGLSQRALIEAIEGSSQLVHSVPPEADPGGPPRLGPLDGLTLIFTDSQVLRVECRAIAGGEVSSLFIDITEYWRIQRALERSRDTAAAADQSKSRFLRAANHDLRQPLASLKILIYSCLSATSEQERIEALHAMDVSASIMEDLLGALLNIGQLDAGKVAARIQTFQVATVLDRLRIQFAHLAREKGIDLRILPSKHAIESDRALLERVLSNFVGNAIRYTDIGRVLVGCRRHGKTLRIEVHDTGCGIAPAHREKIFEEFFRVGGQQSGRHSLGLGLNIARRLADVLGHRITLESTPGKGSMFALDVPLGDVWRSNVGEPEINEKIGGEFTGLCCLVLEDDHHLRDALMTLLRRWGINVEIFDAFDDIPAALKALERTPDIIITDYRLRGGVHGTEIVHQINDLLELPCPAIVVTADTSPDLIADIRRQGFPVMIKPVSPPGLRVIMHNVLFEPELVPELS
ncbi:hybrid sensor histidine kinase/response regulator [Zavarzinia sp.]|uniref:ATP-binding response regulator n=1 Tax=Zavarzinia sp. TaxID=2027920 RepID=UPI003BB7CCF3